MPWFMVDDKLHSHKKAVRAGVQAMGLWVLAGSWSADHLTDGFVPDFIAQRIDPDADMHAAELVTAGLWSVAEKGDDNGWAFHEWEGFQPTKEAVEEKRAAARERMARVRGNKKDGSQEVRANKEGTSREVRLTPAQPSPAHNNSAATAAADAEFDSFWALYPKKVGKGQAVKAYRAALKKATADTIEASLRLQLPWFDAQLKADGDFRPNAATWLNGERWADQVATPKPVDGPRDQWARATVVGGDR